jgi:hypothetical protein
MHMNKLLEKIARLEFVNDQIVAELQHTDKLLRSIGFAEGLKGVKSAAKEILEQEQARDKKENKQNLS